MECAALLDVCRVTGVIADDKAKEGKALLARIARFFGIAKVRVQVTLIAAVANIARLAVLAASAAAV